MSDPRVPLHGRRSSIGALLVRLCIACAILPLPVAVLAQTVVLDFDTPTPHYNTGTPLPITQTAGGITATFGSVPGNGFSLQAQGTTFWTLRQFSGIYLVPSNMNRNHLTIHFDRQLVDITLTFATIEYQDNAEVPSYVKLTAYAGIVSVGGATARGDYLGDTFPMGTLAFHAAQPFDAVDIFVPYTPVGTTEFLADNIIVRGQDAPSFAGAVPDGDRVPGAPLSMGKGVGGVVDLYWSPSCIASDIDYALYEGTLGDFTSHASRQCSTSGATWSTIVPSSGNTYYLIVPHNGSTEGSYGVNSSLSERPAARIPCFPQSLGPCP